MVRDRPTTLWILQRLGKEGARAARLAPHGIEVDIAHNGSVVLTRVFETDNEALGWADEKRSARVAQGGTRCRSIQPGPTRSGSPDGATPNVERRT
jgi:hypothetical protein